MLETGDRLGDEISIIDVIDAGGMGKVYCAWHETLNDEVAVKVSQDPKLEARFRREIRLHYRLGSHPHIVAAKTAGRFNNQYYLMMEYVPGVNLRQFIRDHGPLPYREACACVRQAALGLSHAHSLGIVHRDIKPSNLIRSKAEGFVKILDWGLAQKLDRISPKEDACLTQPGNILGTADYIAPEQISDSTKAGPESDLYSLGCTLYELLTGLPPFHNRPNKLGAHLNDPIPALRSEFAVPSGVEQLLRQLLAKRAEDRFRSAGDLIAALDALEARGAPPPRIPVLEARGALPKRNPRSLDELSDDECRALAQRLIEIRNQPPRAEISVEIGGLRIRATINTPTLKLPDVFRRFTGAMELIPIHEDQIGHLKTLVDDDC